ncbi:hypothetical protein C6A87_025955 [Mycobacterium sp. ITM-2016-00317]|uniref:hypothetical protein n=1 Tax=Mycobacterium sp. ITM-2016-00317 TaxID=2099694 RepID=UPI00287F92EC|nr:hypothetical protein [Mycobacterium sp. ITM-2016-00317]WNG87178.1 hypothetical protein C6A87_025955 [Mycobacterium sp. ITM-2016-00317]
MTETTPAEPEATTAPIPRPAYEHRPPSRLTKAAAWVGIAAGSVFIVAVVFGSGVVVGKSLGDGPRHPHHGYGVAGHSAPPMSPMGPRGGFDRAPGFPGPFGSGGPALKIPREGGTPSPTPVRP